MKNWNDMNVNTCFELVHTFLNELDIISELREGNLKINRDSIVNSKKINSYGGSESEAYNQLISTLKEKFSQRFYYSMKDDDWLWLDIIRK